MGKKISQKVQALDFHAMTENSAHEMANGACLIRFKKKANDGGCTSFQFYIQFPRPAKSPAHVLTKRGEEKLGNGWMLI